MREGGGGNKRTKTTTEIKKKNQQTTREKPKEEHERQPKERQTHFISRYVVSGKGKKKSSTKKNADKQKVKMMTKLNQH